MLKLILLVFASGALARVLPDNMSSDSELAPISKGSLQPTPTITLNGDRNYQANQQIFYGVGWAPWTNCVKPNCTNVLPRDDYVVTPGIGAHKLHTRKLKWNAARKSCENEGGYLVVPNSLAEEAVLIKSMQAANIDNAWLGIHDLFEEGDWMTVMGESLEKSGYDRWTPAIPNDPDNAGGRQNCAILLRKHGGMDDIQCDNTFPYFCEITMC
ncbi:hemolymph lipopolysaccharide-binding protein-like [Hylaeus anthracinus]|uniref:hemolymph lipopolysaccharide-binding protein-like n=1 Tax=Hylaeus anthracinus TaxID=313031 RepID=UPI0023B9D113|nr:hemolymph lipopolysaccharide-binding protein-like [Hylaeus anthracinus]